MVDACALHGVALGVYGDGGGWVGDEVVVEVKVAGDVGFSGGWEACVYGCEE